MKKLLLLISTLSFFLVGCSSQSISECESLIKNTLKSPSSAEFSDMEYAKNSVGAIIVKWNVDSQNSYGAMLRSNFVCYQSEGEEMSYIFKDDSDSELAEANNKIYNFWIGYMNK